MIKQYAILKASLNPSKEDIECMAGLTYTYRDLIKVMEVYKFWFTTDKDISFLQALYREVSKSEIVNPYIIEDRFNALTENAYGTLDMAQINEYKDKGLTIEEIMAANVLSRKGVYTITEILDMKLGGTSWFSVYSDIYSKLENRKNIKISDKTSYDSLSLGEINSLFHMSQISGNKIDKLLKYVDDKEDIGDLLNIYINSQYYGERKNLIKKGLWKYSEEEKEALNQEKNYAQRELKKEKLTVPDFDEMLEDGYSPTDILEAAKKAKQERKSINEAALEIYDESEAE